MENASRRPIPDARGAPAIQGQQRIVRSKRGLFPVPQRHDNRQRERLLPSPAEAIHELTLLIRSGTRWTRNIELRGRHFNPSPVGAIARWSADGIKIRLPHDATEFADTRSTSRQKTLRARLHERRSVKPRPITSNPLPASLPVPFNGENLYTRTDKWALSNSSCDPSYRTVSRVA